MRKSEPRSVQSYSEYFLSMKQQRRFIVRCVPVERTLRFKCKLSLFWNRSIYDEKRDTMSKSFLAWISELSNAVECCIVYQMIHCYEKKNGFHSCSSMDGMRSCKSKHLRYFTWVAIKTSSAKSPR